MDFHEEIIAIVKKKKLSEKELAKIKRELSLKYKLDKIPTNIEILLHATPKDLEQLKPKLLTKPVRTISGVAPVAIMTKPDRCPHGKCTFCVGGIGSPWGDVPQSYTGHEPATMRGMRNNYDAYLQVFSRLEQYILLGQNCEKVEIIVMGGTFTATPLEYQNEFILGIFKALNDFSTMFYNKSKKSTSNGKFNSTLNIFDYLKFKKFFELPGDITNKEREERIKKKILALKFKKITSLEKEQKKNENSHIRCVALCIETKPDWGLLEQGNIMLDQGCTRVELGIESVYDDVLKYVHRGHNSNDSKKSIQILRDLGFKINFHYMPGLPLTDRKRDLEGMKQLFSDENYRPDMIKIYPCMVGPGTALYLQWKKGLFKPINSKEAMSLILEWKKYVPEYCRIQRIQRDVPTKFWEAGVEMTNLRQELFAKNKVVCRCIRCREPKTEKINWKKVSLKVQEFKSSGGREYFISAEDSDNDLLIGFCRLRFPGQFLRREITPSSALIRELHVYGTATAIGDAGKVQHKGWGRKLMQKAEEIVKINGRNKMIVISGVGVRGYYVKLGYKREGPYMVKKLI